MPKVLLAEDDSTMVGLLTTLLRMDGFDVDAVEPEEDVAAAVEQRGPDYLIMDVHLSHQNGLDILQTIRKSNRRLHIIVISGLNVKDESIRRGADEFLLKPFMPDDLMQLLRKKVNAQ